MTRGIGVRALSAAALCLAAALALLAVPSAMPVGARAESGGMDARTLWARVHVIGASASDGFGVRAPAAPGSARRSPMLTLARIAGCARLGETEVTGDATSLFFADPCGTAKAQVDALLAADPRPTVVFADDFLFWFTYGALDAERKPIKEDAQRLALLERGLAELDRAAAAGIPLVVGDVPDMSEAVGKVLTAAQAPSAKARAAANERIRAWAAGKPGVAVLPLARLVEDLRGGQAFDAGRRRWDEAADGPLLQRDRLHPTFAGAVALIARTEQAANECFLGVRQPNAPGAPSAFEHDPAKVAERVREAIASAPPAPRRADQPSP